MGKLGDVVKDTAKDASLSALISLAVSGLYDLFSSPKQSEKIEQVIENNENVVINDNQAEVSNTSHELILYGVIGLLLLIIARCACLLCGRSRLIIFKLKLY